MDKSSDDPDFRAGIGEALRLTRALAVSTLIAYASAARALDARLVAPTPSASPTLARAGAAIPALTPSAFAARPTATLGAPALLLPALTPAPLPPVEARPTPFALAQRTWAQRRDSSWPFESAARALDVSLSAPIEHSGPYGLPPARPLRATEHQPTPDETLRALAEYRRISAAGEEILDAPTWVEKNVEPGLKAAFGVARVEDTLVDYANAVTADVPNSIKGDPVDGLIALRAKEYAQWKEAVARRAAMAMSPAREFAIMRLETMHRMGLVPPGLEKKTSDAPELRAAFARLHAIAIEGRDATMAEARAAVSDVTHLISAATKSQTAPIRARRLELAREADAALATAVMAKASPEEAKTIYETSLARAKDAADPENLRHFMARAAGIRAGTVHASPNLGKQVRPTCTLHMLRGMLASLGIRKTLLQLALEARRLLDDPYVGSVTAFDDAMQLRLFSHYGKVVQLRDHLFENMIGARRSLKIRIEIGEPVYKHSLILEGFYELDGTTWVSLRDSTSYFPTRMSLADFGRALTDDPALYFAEAWAEPR